MQMFWIDQKIFVIKEGAPGKKLEKNILGKTIKCAGRGPKISLKNAKVGDPKLFS